MQGINDSTTQLPKTLKANTQLVECDSTTKSTVKALLGSKLRDSWTLDRVQLQEPLFTSPFIPGLTPRNSCNDTRKGQGSW